MRLHKLQVDEKIDQIFGTVGNLEQRRVTGVEMVGGGRLDRMNLREYAICH